MPSGIHAAYIYIRGEYETVARRFEAAIAEAVREGLPGPEHPRDGVRPRRFRPPGRGRIYLRRGNGPPRVPRGQAGPSAAQASVPGRRRAFREPDRHQQRRNAGQRPGHHPERRRLVSWNRGFPRTAARGSSASAGQSRNPASTSCPWGRACATIIEDHAGGLQDGRDPQGRHPRRHVRPHPDRRGDRPAHGL